LSSQEPQSRKPGGPGMGRGGPHASFARGVSRAKNPRVTLFRLVRYLLASKLKLFFIGLFVVTGTVTSLLGPYYIGIAVDK
jgi:ATP-binding cassette subfamily B multidrug efflux pump